jgi:dUTP pyrophosphatase
MIVKIVNKSENPLPKYESEFASGMDLIANENYILNPNQRVLIHTGIYVEIPQGYEIQIRPRSGNALKSGITVLNTPGTIDSDYRGEIGVILLNTDTVIPFKIEKGKTKIAQAVLCKVERIYFESVKQLNSTDRGTGGFGSTTK